MDPIAAHMAQHRGAIQAELGRITSEEQLDRDTIRFTTEHGVEGIARVSYRASVDGRLSVEVTNE